LSSAHPAFFCCLTGQSRCVRATSIAVRQMPTSGPSRFTQSCPLRLGRLLRLLGRHLDRRAGTASRASILADVIEPRTQYYGLARAHRYRLLQWSIMAAGAAPDASRLLPVHPIPPLSPFRVTCRSV